MFPVEFLQILNHQFITGSAHPDYSRIHHKQTNIKRIPMSSRRNIFNDIHHGNRHHVHGVQGCPQSSISKARPFIIAHSLNVLLKSANGILHSTLSSTGHEHERREGLIEVDGISVEQMWEYSLIRITMDRKKVNFGEYRTF